MSRNSSNTAAVPEAKSALDRFKFEVANTSVRRLQWQPDFQTERKCWRVYGEEDD